MCNYCHSHTTELSQLLHKELDLDHSSKDKCELCGSTDNVKSEYDILICEKCLHKFADQIKYSNKENFSNGISSIKRGVDEILFGLKELYGIDPNDDNFKDTPKRILRLMLEMNYGTNINAAKDILNVSFPTDNHYKGLVAASNIKVFTLCPHHMLPAEYQVSLAYVPSNGRYIGLSKLPRIAKVLARSMLLQEDYTEKLASLLDETLQPSGCAVLVKGVHNCVQCRGVEMVDVYNTTISLRGIFLANPSLKEEWLTTIQNSK